MLKLLERNIASIEERLVLLAPPNISVPASFRNVTFDSHQHDHLVEEMQRLRGSIYLQDGAVQREHLSADGLHRTSEDERSWHLLMLNKRGRVSSCVWYMEHDESARFEKLRVRTCPLSRVEGWREKLWLAVEAELARARQHGLLYAEVGGWAVSKESRCTSEGLLLALAAYSLGRMMGGVLGLTTATVRHSSSTILRRIGGSHLEVEGTPVPSYYDPKYECEMELLRFDSRRPNVKYVGLIDRLKDKLAHVPIIATTPSATAAQPYPFFAGASEHAAA